MYEHAGRLPIKCFVSRPHTKFKLQLMPLITSGRALDYQDTIDNFVAKSRDLRPFEMSWEDWDAIKLVTGWLKSFRSATTQMSATKHSTLSSTHAIFRGLQESLRAALTELPNSANLQIRDALIASHLKLSDYYYKFDAGSPFYVWASRTTFFV